MRATRKLTYALVAGALALPGSAYALGLGKLTVTSALGEPLSAQIELTSASRDELESLTAKVADPSLYRQNNLTYQGVLARARVSVERLPNGNALLKVTSPMTVSEPYLDLLIDVSWASGRVVREYTFLLDPPGMAVAQTADPVTPARGAQTAAAPRAAAPEARPAPQEPRTAERAPQAAAPSDGYVVKRGDTLSKIAQQFKPADVSLEQMLVAMFNSNSGAFEGNNMNRLRTGAIVTVPSSEQIAATPAAEATRVVRVQASDWRTYRDRVAAGAPTVEGGAARQESSGRISAEVKDQAGALPPGRDQIRVSRQATTGSGGTAAAEDAVARDKQLREQQARIAELEKAVRDMQRANEMRGQQLAQAPAASTKGAAPVIPAPIATPQPAAKAEPPKPSVEPPKPAAVEPPKPAVVAESPKPAPVETKPVETPKAEPKALEPIKAPETKAVEKAEPAATDAKAAEPAAKPDTAAKAPPKAPAKAAAPKAEPSFIEDVVSNTPTWVLGAGAAAVLAGIAALIAARRRKTTKFEDSIISGTDIKTNTVFGSTGGGVVNTGENSLASDFSREGLGNIDTDEVDPIAEAEVYLAYGRDAQAEEILKDALKKDPQRQEIYLKLLEIHAQHNKPSAFETVASELYAVSGGQGEVWQKAVALGRQLDPNNPMFAEGGSVPMPKAPAPMADLDADTFSGLGSDLRTEPVIKPPVSDKALDFQLDEDISISPTSGAGKSAADILSGADDVLEKSKSTAMGVVESAAEKSRVAAATAAATAAGTIAAAKAHAEPSLASVADKVEAARAEVAEKFDLDFHLDDDEKPAPFGKARVGAGVAEADPLGGNSLTRPAAALELDKLDLQFDPERSTFEDPTPSVLDGQWHDAATKLDLAKAYQEMGDVEGAREILQEVMHEGDDQQKAEAQGLLAKLG